MLRIGHVDVAEVVNYPSVDLLRHPLVERPISRFHVKYRNLATLGRDHSETTVRVAIDEHRVWLLLLQDRIAPRDDRADCLRCRRPGCIQKVIWSPDFQILEEHFVQLVMVHSNGVNENVIGMPIKLRYDPAQLDDLWAGTHDGEHLEPRRCHAILRPQSVFVGRRCLPVTTFP